MDKPGFGIETRKTLVHFRNAGFGGALGYGIVGLIYVWFPDSVLHQAGVEFGQLCLIGAAIGGGLGRFINALVTGPIGSTVSFYIKLAELTLLGSFMGEELHQEVLRNLIRDYFTGRD